MIYSLDMEPLEVRRKREIVIQAFVYGMPDITFVNSNEGNKVYKAKAPFVVVRIRGGTPNPTPADKNYHQIPYWESTKFTIPGNATWDFDELIRFPLETGLQSISQDKDTLLREGQ